MASFEIPTHHKAAVYDKPGEISTRIDTIETAKPGVGEVLVRLTHSGVCHSDMGVMTNSWKWLPFPTQQGQVGGHEGVGEVVAFGTGPEPVNLKLGDRVGVKWIAGVCGSCNACYDGDDPSCPSLKISGYYTPGTFQQYVVSPASYVTPIPDGLPSDMAAPLLCGGVTVYSALKKTGAKPGDVVVIAGAGGGLGHLALQIGSRALGFRMIGIDSGDKRDLAIDCGCESFFDITKYSRNDEGAAKLAEDIKRATPGGAGATAAIVCTASNAAYAQSLTFLKSKGTVVCVGVPEGEMVPIGGASPGIVIAKQLKIVGSAVGNRMETIETLNFAARGLVKTKFTVEPLSSLTDTFQKMDKGQLQGRVVIDLLA